MDENTSKINGFINHLLQNENIKNEPIVIAETFIINFISKNINVLKQNLASPQFFPDTPVDETLRLILSTLREKVIKEIKPELIKHISRINFTVLNAISGSEPIGQDFLKEKFKQFIDVILTHKEVRFYSNAVINILNYNALEKYITKIFERREFIYNELVKVQKNNLKADQYIDYLKILLLIKNTAYIKFPFSSGADSKNVNLSDIQKIHNPKTLDTFFTLVESNIAQSLPGVNKTVLRMALKANCPTEQTKLEEASARFLYALAGRFQEYKHFDKIDRGAETPDKSWFNIAKKNTESHGYNQPLIEELYKIAADNGW